MDISAYCSSTFDTSCRLTPDFFDILTMPLVENHKEAFRGLLDTTEVGIYMFHDSNSLVVFDTGASVSISPDPSDFVSWDDHIDVPALQGITFLTPIQGSGSTAP